MAQKFDTPSDAQSLVRTWNDAGLPLEPIQPVSDLLERAKAIGREHIALRDGTSSAGKDVAEKVVAGEITFAEGVIQLAALVAVNAGGGTPYGFALSRAAGRVVLNRIAEFLQENAQALFEEQIEPVLDQTKSDALKLARDLVGVGNAGSAMSGGPKSAQAWSKLQALEERRVLMAKAFALLVRYGDLGAEIDRTSLFRIVAAANAQAEIQVGA